MGCDGAIAGACPVINPLDEDAHAGDAHPVSRGGDRCSRSDDRQCTACFPGVDDQHVHGTKQNLHHAGGPGNLPDTDHFGYGRTMDDHRIDAGQWLRAAPADVGSSASLCLCSRNRSGSYRMGRCCLCCGNGFACHGLKSRGINAGWNPDQGPLFLTSAALDQVTKYLAQTGTYLVTRHRTDQDRVLTLEGTHLPSSSFPQFRGLPLFTLPLS